MIAEDRAEGEYVVTGLKRATKIGIDEVIDAQFGLHTDIHAPHREVVLDGEAQIGAQAEKDLPMLRDIDAESVGGSGADEGAFGGERLKGSIIDAAEMGGEIVLLDAGGEMETAVEPVAEVFEPSVGEIEGEAWLDILVVKGVGLRGAEVAGRESVAEVHRSADIEADGLLGGEGHQGLSRSRERGESENGQKGGAGFERM